MSDKFIESSERDKLEYFKCGWDEMECCPCHKHCDSVSSTFTYINDYMKNDNPFKVIFYNEFIAFVMEDEDFETREEALEEYPLIIIED